MPEVGLGTDLYHSDINAIMKRVEIFLGLGGK